MSGKASIPNSSNQPGGPLTPGLTIMNNVAVSSTTTYHSDIFKANILDNIGLDIALTGTMVGTVSVECSIDGITFRALTFSPALTQPAGSAVAYLVSLNQLPYPYLRVSYVNASGSGHITVKLSAKGLS